MPPLRVLLVSAEVAPLAQTGGLADVTTALAVALRGLGVDARIAVPGYRTLLRQPLTITPAVAAAFAVPLGDQTLETRLLRTDTPAVGAPVYIVDQPSLFDREGLYQQPDDREHPDNLERFTVLCRGVLEGLPRTDWRPDVVHAHDWHAALLPTYLRTVYRTHPAWRAARTCFTIHNMAYQGQFPRRQLALLGLGASAKALPQLIGHGRLCLLKAGLSDADVLTTVSPTYAREIQTPALGCGLDDVARQRAAVLHGILNGIDTRVWDPTADTLLPATFSSGDLRGKAVCKTALQTESGLTVEPATPLIGLVTRLAEQKGIDLALEALGALLARGACQVVLLGTGDHRLQRAIEALQRRHPQRMHATLTFSERLAHRIEAGADVFLMPSRYEPCGLNQMYSQRYGTVPVVRRTGGLADTVVDATPPALRDGTATGVLFEDATGAACLAALERALALYRDPVAWRRLQQRGMQQDFSWARSARQYVALYDTVRARPAATARVHR